MKAGGGGEEENCPPPVVKAHQVCWAPDDADLTRSGPVAGTACEAAGGSTYLPKIILPAVVCSTLVTMISIVLLIILRALSTTTIVPSSRYATPWLYSLPSLRMKTFISSPGRTTGLS